MTQRRYDTTSIPSIRRNAIGFDRMFDLLENGLTTPSSTNGYPPYNVAQIDENDYMVTLAVAGFSMDDLEITLDGNTLTISGTAPGGDESITYLHKGIAGRNFKREFTLAEHIEVESAELENGMLNVKLVRHVPEELLPRTIEIKQIGSKRK